MTSQQPNKRSRSRASEDEDDNDTRASLAGSSEFGDTAIVVRNGARKKRFPPAAAALATSTRRKPKIIWRTRDQENSLLYNYQLDVAALQSELNNLQQYRNMLMHRALNRRDGADGIFVKLVREYFKIFKHGYTPARPGRLQLTADAGPTDTFSPVDEFVRRVVDDHVMIGRFAGLKQMMKQWERYTSMLGPMTLSFLDSHVISIDNEPDSGENKVLVTSRAKYHLYISLSAIESMFPHLLEKKDIVTKILGRRITGVGKFDFVFDATTNCIVRYEFSLDLMSSFIDLLGDPSAAAVLLHDALISDEFFIGDLSDFEPQRDEVRPVSAAIIEELRQDTQPTPHHKPASPRVVVSSDRKRPWKMKISSILSDTAVP